MNTYKEKNQAENLKANARTKKLIESGANDFELQTAESVRVLVSQIAFYRGVDLTTAKKLLGQLLRGVTK